MRTKNEQKTGERVETSRSACLWRLRQGAKSGGPARPSQANRTTGGSEVDTAALALPVPVTGGVGAFRPAGFADVPGFRVRFLFLRRGGPGPCIGVRGGRGSFTGRLSGWVFSGHFPLTAAHAFAAYCSFSASWWIRQGFFSARANPPGAAGGSPLAPPPRAVKVSRPTIRPGAHRETPMLALLTLMTSTPKASRCRASAHRPSVAWETGPRAAAATP